jgi:hypothetical protein
LPAYRHAPNRPHWTYHTELEFDGAGGSHSVEDNTEMIFYKSGVRKIKKLGKRLAK